MRQLPYSVEAEMALLGTLLVFPEAVSNIAEYNLRLDDFYLKNHQIIFEHMMEIIHRGLMLDAVTITTRLKDHGDIESIGGSDYLFSLTQNSATPGSLKHYVDVVQE